MLSQLFYRITQKAASSEWAQDGIRLCDRPRAPGRLFYPWPVRPADWVVPGSICARHRCRMETVTDLSG